LWQGQSVEKSIGEAIQRDETHSAESEKMLPTPAKVLHVDNLYNEYFVTIHVGRADFNHTSAGDHA
jgi:hypothetical protein